LAEQASKATTFKHITLILYSWDETMINLKRQGGRVEQKYRPNVQWSKRIENELLTLENGQLANKLELI
jgi:hypothetical protein